MRDDSRKFFLIMIACVHHVKSSTKVPWHQAQVNLNRSTLSLSLLVLIFDRSINILKQYESMYQWNTELYGYQAI
jgi:hypothetical protein